jgi:Family of unknown function (DUF6282)
MTAGQKRFVAVLGSVMAVAAGLRTAGVTLGAQTAWESYKTRQGPPSVDRHLTDPALIGAVDLHAHHDPDSYPRQSDAFEIARLMKDRGLRGMVLKNHWTETGGLAYLVRKYATPDLEVFGALSLDTPVGGMNPQAVRYLADVTGHLGRIVWMPTHDSEHEVTYLKENRPFVPVSRGGKLLPETLDVIAVIAKSDLALATGHVAPEEAMMILREAKRAGVQRLIVTHPLLGPQYTDLTIDQMLEASKLGAYIEIVSGNVTRPGQTLTRTVEAIRRIGPEMCFVSSDSGLAGGANHTDSLALAAKALRDAGFRESDLNRMFKENPARLVKLPIQASTTASNSRGTDR